MAKFEELDRLLRAADLNASIIELDNFICEQCKWGEALDNLSKPQRVFYFNQELEREVNNGGFHQYFLNSSGNFAVETVQGLKEIGALQTAKILVRAIQQFPNSLVPEDRDQRHEVMLTDVVEPDHQNWEELDHAFYAYEEDLNELNIEYVRKHLDAF